MIARIVEQMKVKSHFFSRKVVCFLHEKFHFHAMKASFPHFHGAWHQQHSALLSFVTISLLKQRKSHQSFSHSHCNALLMTNTDCQWWRDSSTLRILVSVSIMEPLDGFRACRQQLWIRFKSNNAVWHWRCSLLPRMTEIDFRKFLDIFKSTYMLPATFTR